MGRLLKSMFAANTKGDGKLLLIDIPHADGVHDLYFSYTNPNLKKPETTGCNSTGFISLKNFPERENRAMTAQ